jgi:hypothetical protein
MGRLDFHLHTEWRVPADADAVYRVLRDVEHYPQWWPQVHRVVKLSEDSGELHIRSHLPRDLIFRVEPDVEDASARLLRARMSGDLTGWSQWRVRPAGAYTGVAFDEQVRVSGPLLRLGSVFARPLLVANHAAMMRAGQRGLAARLTPAAATG